MHGWLFEYFNFWEFSFDSQLTWKNTDWKIEEKCKKVNAYDEMCDW